NPNQRDDNFLAYQAPLPATQAREGLSVPSPYFGRTFRQISSPRLLYEPQSAPAAPMPRRSGRLERPPAAAGPALVSRDHTLAARCSGYVWASNHIQALAKVGSGS